MPGAALAQRVLEGLGLHSGKACRLVLERRAGPMTVVRGGRTCALHELVVGDTTRSTTLTSPDGALSVRTVEHLFAALAGLGVHEGLVLRIEGDELPLLDGGARAYADAIAELGIEASRPSLRVVREGEVTVGASRYRFRPGLTEMKVTVRVDFGDARLAPEASWSGAREDFLQRVAPARTFGFEHEIAMLLERGLASYVAPSSVVLIGKDVIHGAGAPVLPDEPARHKLLDLLGDLYVHGGPPFGCVDADRPGHAATHAAVAEARARGILTRTV